METEMTTIPPRDPAMTTIRNVRIKGKLHMRKMMAELMKYLHDDDLNINLYAQFGIATKVEHFL